MTVVTSTEKKILELDDILVKFSLFGKYYVQSTVVILLAYMSNSIYCANFVFVAEEVSYRCKDESFINDTCSDLNNASHRCTKWVYDNPHSLVAEYDLACQDWKRTLVGTVHSFGYMIGLLIIGPLSDRLGRKKVIVITGVVGGVLGMARSFSPWYWLFIALEFLEAALGDICSPIFMLTMEMVANNKRLIYQMICGFGFSIGGIGLPLFAWLFPYWRHLLRVLYTPALLFFLYLLLLDESPRWLLSKGKKDEAVQIIQKIAKTNKVKIDKAVLDKLSCEENIKEATFPELLKSTFTSVALLRRFFICLTWWTTSTFVNYGLMINSVSLQGNKYLNFALINMVDFPGNLITTFLMIRFKRKIPLIFTFVFTAILCLSQPFVPRDLPWLSIFLYVMGKFVSSSYFAITYIFTSELFPTYTRNSMHALCSSLGRIGSILAPQTPLLSKRELIFKSDLKPIYLMSCQGWMALISSLFLAIYSMMHYWPGLPSLVFGGTSLLAGMATLFVPDTADTSLPDNVKQAELLGSRNKEKGIE